MTDHVQTPARVLTKYGTTAVAHVDEGVSELVELLARAGVPTFSSCENCEGRQFIVFHGADNLRRALDVLPKFRPDRKYNDSAGKMLDAAKVHRLVAPLAALRYALQSRLT